MSACNAKIALTSYTSCWTPNPTNGESEMLFEIKNRFSSSVLFSLETESLKLCVEAAVKIKADLRGADLRGADLRDADLRDADLGGADLRGADLRGAYLRSVKDVICAGIPKNYWFHGWYKDGVLMIRGGCHSF